MDQVTQRLGLTEHEFTEIVIQSLRAAKATHPSAALQTDKIAKQVVKLGLERPIGDIGEQMCRLASNNGPLRFFAHFIGGAKEPWMDYEWYMNLPENDPDHPAQVAKAAVMGPVKLPGSTILGGKK